MDMSNLRCGITERGDAGIDFRWTKNLMPKINIIISKKLTDKLIEELIKHKDRVIFHHTVTGYGETIIEELVPSKHWSHMQCLKLIKAGFPVEQIVLRVDPVIPTPKGINVAKSVLDLYKDTGIKRVKFSFLDLYPHVIERFVSRGVRIPWNGFNAPKEMQYMFLRELSNYDYEFESCAEYNEHKVGCISEKDYKILNLPIPQTNTCGQRKTCSCLSTKTELLSNPIPCANKCLYCFWKDKR